MAGLADFINTNPGERGKRKPHQSTVKKLAAALSVEVRDLLRDE